MTEENRNSMSLGGTDLGEALNKAAADTLAGVPPASAPVAEAAPVLNLSDKAPIATDTTSLLRRVSSSGLTTIMDNYLEAVKDQLVRKLTEYRMFDTIKVTSRPVSTQGLHVECITLNDKFHTLVGFSETRDRRRYEGRTTTAVKDLSKVVTALNAAGTPVNHYILVDETYYNRPLQLGTMLAQELTVAAFPEEGQIDIGMLCSSNYSISVDANEYRRVLDEIWPSDILPRSDIGMCVYTNPSDGSPKELMLSFGGYTTFNSPNRADDFGSIKAARPTTALTAMFSPTPSTNMAALGIILANYGFLTEKGWTTQFTDPLETLGKEKKDVLNIGNLLSLRDKAGLYDIDRNGFMDFINTYLEQPHLLAIDIDIGAPRIPGIEAIINGSLDNVIKEFVRPLGGDMSTFDHTSMTAGVHEQIIGDCSGVDTREVADYLNLCVENRANAESFMIFLARNTNPDFTISKLQEIMPGVAITPRYDSYRVLLNYGFLEVVWNIMAPSLATRLYFEQKLHNDNNVGPLPTGGNTVFNNQPIMGGTAVGINMPFIGGQVR